MTNPSGLPDIPDIQLTGNLSVLEPMFRAIKEAIQVGAGVRGNKLDRFVRDRDLVARGVLTPQLKALAAAPGPAGAPGVPGPPGGPPVPDLTPPPTATGLVLTAGLTNVIIQCDAPGYTQGHGHDRTIVYGAKWAVGAAEPVFADAVRIWEFTGPITAYPTEINTRWCIWIKWQSVDGIQSTNPAGGTHGVQATTGKIGNADLNDLIVSAEKLSIGTYAGINMVPNPGAEDGVVAWVATGELTGAGGTFTVDTAQKTGGKQSFRISKVSSGADGQGVACRAMPVIPGETYSFKIKVLGSSATATGLYLRCAEKTAAPASGYVDNLNRDSLTDLVANGAIAASWTSYEFTYTVPANRYWVSISVYNWAAAGIGGPLSVWFDDVAFGRQITASHLAAGSIAVGTLAVQNGAIVNAMLGTASIDDLKVANISAAKLTAGDGTIGGNLKSSNYVAGVSGWLVQPNGNAEFAASVIRGQLVASQIDTRGLDIKTAGGAVIFSAATNLDFARINPDSGWLNANIRQSRNWVRGIATWALVVGASRGALGNEFADGNYIVIPTGSNTAFAQSPTMALINGGTYTASFLAWASVARNMTVDLFPDTLPEQTIALTTTPTLYKLSWTLASADAASCVMRVFSYDATPGDIIFGNPQIELGPYTPWKPANEDVPSPANMITSGNVTTFIANAAMGSAQIGVLTAGNLTVSALSNTINGSAGSGQRVEVQTNKVLVYDAANVLRVKMGDLS